MMNKQKWYKKTWIVVVLLVVFYPLGLWLVLKSNWSRRTKAIVAVSATMVLLLPVIAGINAPPILYIDNLKTDQMTTIKDETYKVTGTVAPRSATLTINAKTTYVDGSGKFSQTIPLKDGENSIEITAKANDKITTETYKVKRLSAAEIAEQKRQQAEKDRKAAEDRQKQETTYAAAKKAADQAALDKKQADEKKAAATTVPHFSDYLNKPMATVATEFGQTYDASYSTQISAEKNGYKLYFEDGGHVTETTKENTGKANITNVELPQMGKCTMGQVFIKIDDAMRLTGLNPATKGDKYDGMGGTQLGYGAYRNYKGDKTLEIALLCDYTGDNYKLQLRILPEYR